MAGKPFRRWIWNWVEGKVITYKFVQGVFVTKARGGGIALYLHGPSRSNLLSLARSVHGCRWETFYIFAYCGLVVGIQALNG